MEGRIARKRMTQGWRWLMLYLNTRTRLQVVHHRVCARARKWKLSVSIGVWGYHALVSRHHTRLLARHLVKTVAVRLRALAWRCWRARHHLLRAVQRRVGSQLRRRLGAALGLLRSAACQSQHETHNQSRVRSRCADST